MFCTPSSLQRLLQMLHVFNSSLLLQAQLNAKLNNSKKIWKSLTCPLHGRMILMSFSIDGTEKQQEQMFGNVTCKYLEPHSPQIQEWGFWRLKGGTLCIPTEHWNIKQKIRQEMFLIGGNDPSTSQVASCSGAYLRAILPLLSNFETKRKS